VVDNEAMFDREPAHLCVGSIMRPLFVVGVNLIGVLVLYWAPQHIPVVLGTISFFWIELPETAPRFSLAWELTSVCVGFLIALAFGIFLLVRGEVLATWVPLSETSSSLPNIQAAQLLRLGIIIAGVLVAADAASR